MRLYAHAIFLWQVTMDDLTKILPVAMAGDPAAPLEPLGENQHDSNANANANTAPVAELTATMAAASL